MKFLKRIALVCLFIAVVTAVGGWLGYLAVRSYFAPQLPSYSALKHIKLGEPLRIYTSDGKLIAQFGAERRDSLSYSQIPPQLRHAFLAAEDSSFYGDGAVDWLSLLRAAWVLISTGQKRQGGSTIDMQLARDLFLSPKKTYTRKIKEILIAQRLDQIYTKQQILTLYLNRVYLGSGAYGVGAAAHTYYGKSVDKLSLSQMATLAGLPQAPSIDNPIYSPTNARIRRNYVLGRMHALGWINARQYRRALAQPVVAHMHTPQIQLHAPYAAEMAREALVQRYGNKVYQSGDVVTVTIDSKKQKEARRALRAGLIDYTERHKYRGPAARLPPKLIGILTNNPHNPTVLSALNAYPTVGGLRSAIVISVSQNRIRLTTKDGLITLKPTDFQWAHPAPRGVLRPGDIVRIRSTGTDDWQLAQIPKVEGAFVALDPDNGAIQALVGGFDYAANSYNRAINAERQVGSGFKPYYYSAALAEGYTPASTFLDAPVVVPGQGLLAETWRPMNDNDSFGGPMRLRVALARSVNLVSIRLFRALGIDRARRFVSNRFGIPVGRIPDNLTAALGTATLSPLEQARGYAVFANGGFLVNPFLISKIQSENGKTIYQAHPLTACSKCADDPVPAPPSSSTIAPAASVASSPLPQTPATASLPATQTSVSTNQGDGDSWPIISEPGVPFVTAINGHAPRTLGPVTVYLIDSMLRSVITSGTGRSALQLRRADLAGKTGSTNNQTNAWFNGFNPSLVAVAWVGFDKLKTLGWDEYGAVAALPIWINFMDHALKNVPVQTRPRPAGIVKVWVDPKNGERVGPGFPGAIREIVQANHLPPVEVNSGNPSDNPLSNPTKLLY